MKVLEVSCKDIQSVIFIIEMKMNERKSADKGG